MTTHDKTRLDPKALKAATAAVRAEWKSIDQRLALPAGASQSIAPTNHGLLSAAISAYLSALLPEDAAGLVEPLSMSMFLSPSDMIARLLADRAQAASLVQSQAARIVELEAGIADIEDAANSFQDESGYEVAGQIRIRARVLLNRMAER